MQRQADTLLGSIALPVARASLQEGTLLAWHLPLGMLEAGTVLPTGWPQWSADPQLIGFCQSLKVSIGWGGAVVHLRRLLVQNSTQWVSSSLILLILSLAGRWLVAL